MDKLLLGDRWTSRIGFGCGRLVGGASARASVQLIEQARGLGVSHFDVAPSYGIGLAEDVLGVALKGDKSVTITTKAGIGRPSQPFFKAAARQALRPVLRRFPNVRARMASFASDGGRVQVAPGQILISLEESLKRLQRDSVDVFLLHEPGPMPLPLETMAVLDEIVGSGKTRLLGVGTAEAYLRPQRPDLLMQHRFSFDDRRHLAELSIAHGLLRSYKRPERLTSKQAALIKELGWEPNEPGAWTAIILTAALASSRNLILLVSTTSPQRLTTTLGLIDWPIVRQAGPNFTERVRSLFSWSEPS